MIIDAFKVIQKGGNNSFELYITTLKAIDIAERCVIDRWTSTNFNGYQRMPNLNRLNDDQGGIVRYILKDLACFPTSILLNVRDKITFNKTITNEYYEFGKLDLGDSHFWLIDGQHRIEALKRAYSRNKDFENYPVIVSLLVKPNRFDELLLFYIVNKKQKSVPTDLAYRHLQRMLWEKGSRWLYEFEGARGVRLGLASEIIDLLNSDHNSPWYKRIRMVGEVNNVQFLVDDRFFISVIAKILKNKVFTGLPVNDFAQYIIEYWNCIRDVYPEAFKEPERYTLLSRTGVYVFTTIFPTLMVKFLKNTVRKKENLLNILLGLKKTTICHSYSDFIKPIYVESWSKENAPSIFLGQTSKDLEKLTLGIQEKLMLSLKSENDIVQMTL